jgi:Protein of unknown function (DUF3040)
MFFRLTTISSMHFPVLSPDCPWEGTVPLSEHEQRVLEQIERALYADDPKFAATVRGIDPRTLVRRRIVRAIVGVLVGLALLPVGIAVKHIEITLAGFLLALLAAWYGVSTWKRAHSPAPAVAPEPVARRRWLLTTRRGRAGSTSAAQKPVGQPQLQPRSTMSRGRRQHEPGPKPGLLQRFEDRWNRRRDSNFGG